MLNSADVHEMVQIYTLPVTAEETAKETKDDTELNDIYLALLSRHNEESYDFFSTIMVGTFGTFVEI